LAGSALQPGPQGLDSAAARAAGLIAVAEDLAGEFSLRPLLERILRRCTELLDCDAGSICSVDEAAGTYRKEADIGVACQSGQVFPLTEGMTGAVVAWRAPVWFARYDQVPGGHVAAEERATLRGVIGVPLEWRGRIIGACIVFSRDERREFGPADAELLRLFAKHAAIALANARMHETAEERARAEAAAAERDRLLGELHDTLAQSLVSVQVHLDRVQRELTASADGRGADEPFAALAGYVGQAAAATREALVEARQTLLLAAVPRQAVVGLCEAGDDELVADAMRAGARGCVDLGATGPQLAQAVVATGRGQAILSDVVLGQLHRGMRTEDPLTEREREVRELMEQGLPDRVIAQRLVLSVKTVEKHAGAVLRKTGARNRTELAALAGRSRLR
jgi:DNA-binding NarL/FixJ family response regulator